MEDAYANIFALTDTQNRLPARYKVKIWIKRFLIIIFYTISIEIFSSTKSCCIISPHIFICNKLKIICKDNVWEIKILPFITLVLNFCLTRRGVPPSLVSYFGNSVNEKTTKSTQQLFSSLY